MRSSLTLYLFKRTVRTWNHTLTSQFVIVVVFALKHHMIKTGTVTFSCVKIQENEKKKTETRADISEARCSAIFNYCC